MRTKKNGFSIFELVVALVIVGLFSGLVSQLINVNNYQDKALIRLLMGNSIKNQIQRQLIFEGTQYEYINTSQANQLAQTLISTLISKNPNLESPSTLSEKLILLESKTLSELFNQDSQADFINESTLDIKLIDLHPMLRLKYTLLEEHKNTLDMIIESTQTNTSLQGRAQYTVEIKLTDKNKVIKSSTLKLAPYPTQKNYQNTIIKHIYPACMLSRIYEQEFIYPNSLKEIQTRLNQHLPDLNNKWIIPHHPYQQDLTLPDHNWSLSHKAPTFQSIQSSCLATSKSIEHFFSPGIYEYKLPTTTSFIKIELWGARGQSGLGHYKSQIYNIIDPSQPLSVVVGQSATSILEDTTTSYNSWKNCGYGCPTTQQAGFSGIYKQSSFLSEQLSSSLTSLPLFASRGGSNTGYYEEINEESNASILVACSNTFSESTNNQTPRLSSNSSYLGGFVRIEPLYGIQNCPNSPDPGNLTQLAHISPSLITNEDNTEVLLTGQNYLNRRFYKANGEDRTGKSCDSFYRNGYYECLHNYSQKHTSLDRFDIKYQDALTTKYPSEFFGYYDFSTPTINGQYASTTNFINEANWGSYYTIYIYGYFKAPVSDTYTFKTDSDDASHVYINNQLLVNNGGTHDSISVSSNIYLEKDEVYFIEIFHSQWTNSAHLRFYWQCYSSECPQTSLTQSLNTYFYTHNNDHTGFPRKTSISQSLPLPVTLNLQLHLDANNINGNYNFNLTDEAPIGSWLDLSFVSNHAVQNTYHSQPTFKKNAFGLGLDALSFNHTSSQYFNLPNGTIPYNNDNYTVFAVVKANTSGTDSYCCGGIIGSGSYGSYNQSNAFRFNTNSFYNYWWENDLIGDLENTDDKKMILEFHYNNNQGRKLYKNETLIATNMSTYRNSTEENNTIGKAFSNEFFNGEIAEILVYKTALSDSNRAEIYNYLNKRWNTETWTP